MEKTGNGLEGFDGEGQVHFWSRFKVVTELLGGITTFTVVYMNLAFGRVLDLSCYFKV